MVSLKGILMVRYVMAILLLGGISFFGHAQRLRPLESSSKISFTIKNFGVGVDGSFSGINGEIYFDPNQLSNSRFSVTVQAATINTGISSRDKHLIKEDYFDAGRHSQLRFESVAVTKTTNTGSYILKGNLTIKGISKPVQIPFTVTQVNNGYAFKGSFTINRRDFGVGGSSISLSDELKVELLVTAIQS